ncbi:MAG: DUF177 domain-containing protein [Bacteroidales bacterium]|jgi:uncharacterized metal-binding protein YceD (DUF177 family)|nr:DUF177 domain-containing protein [Bacteroidales bacterium]NLH23206.1 hypothetical protein [Bacteroidales bacterium]
MEQMENTRLKVAVKTFSKGTYDYAFRLDKSFFSSFQNEEILDAELNTEIQICRIEEQEPAITVKISGTVVVMCDRCLDKLAVPVSFESKLDEEETLECRNDFSGQMDFTQYVYDNICLAIPIRRFHESEKDCDQEMLRIWKQGSVQDKHQDDGSCTRLADFMK